MDKGLAFVYLTAHAHSDRDQVLTVCSSIEYLFIQKFYRSGCLQRVERERYVFREKREGGVPLIHTHHRKCWILLHQNPVSFVSDHQKNAFVAVVARV